MKTKTFKNAVLTAFIISALAVCIWYWAFYTTTPSGTYYSDSGDLTVTFSRPDNAEYHYKAGGIGRIIGKIFGDNGERVWSDKFVVKENKVMINPYRDIDNLEGYEHIYSIIDRSTFKDEKGIYYRKKSKW